MTRFWPHACEADSDEQERVHVYPLFGREHEVSTDCWCHPLPDEEMPNVIVHNVLQ